MEAGSAANLKDRHSAIFSAVLPDEAGTLSCATNPAFLKMSSAL